MKSLPTWVEIDLDQFARNLDCIRAHVAPADVLLTVKADAYGHGAVQVAQAVGDRVCMLGVATVDEARELREAGVTTRILVLSPVLDTEIPAVAAGRFAVTVSSRTFAEQLSTYGSKNAWTFDIHVEVDTGMGRTGIPMEHAREEIKRIAQLDFIHLEGVYTHFPVSDSDHEFTRRQAAALRSIVADLEADGVSVPLVHSANSAAIAGIPESIFTMVRPGLIAYGLHPTIEPPPIDVKPILSWKSRIARVRRVPAEHTISYGREFTTQRDSWIGVVPVGYGHGYPFRLSRGADMIVAGTRVPVVGRVTMDMTMIDLTDLKHVPHPGEPVVLAGEQGDTVISFHELARRSGSICYETLCGISKRVPRTYFRGGRVATYKSLLGILPNQITV